MSRESSLTLDRGLALLQAVADAGDDAATISELAAAIGASRAAVYRLLVPLAERGLVWRDGSKVRLGVGLLRLCGQVLPQLRQAAQPVLRELAEDVGATAHLSVAEGDQVQAIAVVEPSWTSFHVAYRVGSRHPISRGAAGKAMTLRSGARRQWVTTTGELQPGASGVAAPVRGVPGLRASVGVVSLHALDTEKVGPRVVAAAGALAEVLAPTAGQARVDEL
ncbi:DNA-binding transcriptional regulator, IclR family [Amycolatopsis arida]|uniref:DNA-binding transcriptional regulator, IclR family n=1 Tax=Amycolatopsis arida TaxID=587909 RepID=A0A1I5YMW7_9PSEU|nr:helix-turn-helix domain-containing protein [Amycolatopsis arida]TDX90634.1 DNA-binding IclR family transcriptional regulator [Amycolatopsis arida]SFQ45523.1 DNA-binding transcriptional regulator, IclR family [Amycolatopsis arida]